MKGRKKNITVVFVIAVVLVLLLYAFWSVRATVSSPLPRVPFDFEVMERTGKPNDYLVCPPDICSTVPDEVSPVFKVPVSRLQQEVLAVVRSQPRIKSLTGSEGAQYEFVQRTGLMNFPDTITVRFYALDGNRSTLAIYSRSHFGYYDLGVNRKRVKSWLLELKQRVSSLFFAPAFGAASHHSKDIVDTAVGAGSFTTLVAAVKAAGLVETLKNPGPFTVFAPTDEAFAKLPEGTVEALLNDKAKLTAILTYHVAPGKMMAADVVNKSAIKTVQGQSLQVSTSDGARVDNANIIKTDIECSNGVIHVIDTVVLPD